MLRIAFPLISNYSCFQSCILPLSNERRLSSMCTTKSIKVHDEVMLHLQISMYEPRFLTHQKNKYLLETEAKFCYEKLWNCTSIWCTLNFSIFSLSLVYECVAYLQFVDFNKHKQRQATFFIKVKYCQVFTNCIYKIYVDTLGRDYIKFVNIFLNCPSCRVLYRACRELLEQEAIL